MKERKRGNGLIWGTLVVSVLGLVYCTGETLKISGWSVYGYKSEKGVALGIISDNFVPKYEAGDEILEVFGVDGAGCEIAGVVERESREVLFWGVGCSVKRTPINVPGMMTG
jgi:hypothetical protein